MRFSVDIIIAAYNAERTIERAIDSACLQNECDVNIYVVDDGSTDNTASLASNRSLSDSRIQLISQSNMGTGAARNIAIFSGRSDWVSYLDADDELAPDWGSKMATYLDLFPEFDVYSSNGIVLGNDGHQGLVFNRKKQGAVTLDDLLGECAVLGGGALVSREVMQILNGFSEEKYGEDYDLWLRLAALNFKIFYSPDALYMYHQEGDKRKSDDLEKGALSGVEALENIMENFGLTESQKIKAKKTIDRYKNMGALKVQSDNFRHFLEKTFGKCLGKKIWVIFRHFSFLVRPLRGVVLRCRR